MTALDTSVVVAAFASWHEAHAVAVEQVRAGALVPAQALTETYAVLTRLPEPFRIDPGAAAEYLHQQRHGRVLMPDVDLASELPLIAAAAGVWGGATYDALVATTAQRAGHSLVSLDARAERTYRALGVSYRLLS